MKHASALVAVLARNLTSATSKGHLQQAGMSTSIDSSAAAHSESADGQDDGNLHARHAHYSFIMILILMTLFILVTLSLTGAMLAFCRKKNTVFTHYDGVATTSGEYTGRGGGGVSVDGNSELELGDLDVDGEDMCGAPDRGQCYYQLSDDDDDDDSDSSDDKSDENDEKIRRNEQKKMLKHKTGSKWISNRRKEDGKKEVILEVQSSERHLNSDNHVVSFPTNKSCHKNTLTTMFKLFKKKDRKSLTKITSTTNNGNSNFCNKSSLATKSKTFPPISRLDLKLEICTDFNRQDGSKSIKEDHQITNTESNGIPAVQTLPSRDSVSPVDPAISFYPSSRSKRRQLNGIGNANFKAAGGRRRKNMTCVNPQHDHSRTRRQNQNIQNGNGSTHNACNRNEARKLRHHQGHSYQARLLRRLQEQAARLNRDGVVTSPTVSDYWACAEGKSNPKHYHMHELRRYLADPYGGNRLHRCHSIHAIPQTGPESITDTVATANNDVVHDGGWVGSAGTSTGSGRSSKTFRVRGCRTSSKCGITIVRVEPSIEIPDEYGDAEFCEKARSSQFLEFQRSHEKRIPGIGEDQIEIYIDNNSFSEKASERFETALESNRDYERDCLKEGHSNKMDEADLKIFERENNVSLMSYSQPILEESKDKDNVLGSHIPGAHHQLHSVKREELEDEKHFRDVYLLPDLNSISSCCEPPVSDSQNISDFLNQSDISTGANLFIESGDASISTTNSTAKVDDAFGKLDFFLTGNGDVLTTTTLLSPCPEAEASLCLLQSQTVTSQCTADLLTPVKATPTSTTAGSISTQQPPPPLPPSQPQPPSSPVPPIGTTTEVKNPSSTIRDTTQHTSLPPLSTTATTTTAKGATLSTGPNFTFSQQPLHLTTTATTTTKRRTSLTGSDLTFSQQPPLLPTTATTTTAATKGATSSSESDFTYSQQQQRPSVTRKPNQTAPSIVTIPPPPKSQRSSRQARNSPRHRNASTTNTSNT